MADPVRPSTGGFAEFFAQHIASSAPGNAGPAGPVEDMWEGGRGGTRGGGGVPAPTPVSTPTSPTSFADFYRQRTTSIDLQNEGAPAPIANNTPDPNDRSWFQRVTDPFGLQEALLQGLEQGTMQAIAAGAKTLGADEFAANQLAIAEASRRPPSMQEVTGFTSAARWVYGLLGQSAPEMAAVTAAAIGGSMAGGPVAGGAAAYATSTLFNTGRNLQRQEEETGQSSYGPAVVGALAQSGLDVIVPGKLGGLFGSRVAGAVEDVVARGIVREVTGDTVKESATELGQQMIEIAQANPDLFRVMVNPRDEQEMQKSDQLVMELVESAVGGAAAGGVVSSLVRSAAPSPKDGPTGEAIKTAADAQVFSDKDLGVQTAEDMTPLLPAPGTVQEPPAATTTAPAVTSTPSIPPAPALAPAPETPAPAPTASVETPAPVVPPAGVLPAQVPATTLEISPNPPPPVSTQPTPSDGRATVRDFENTMAASIPALTESRIATLQNLPLQGVDHSTGSIASDVGILAQNGFINIDDDLAFNAYLNQQTDTLTNLPKEQLAATYVRAYQDFKYSEAYDAYQKLKYPETAAMFGPHVKDIQKSPRLMQLVSLAYELTGQENRTQYSDRKELFDAVKNEGGASPELVDYVTSSWRSDPSESNLHRLINEVHEYGELRSELDRIGLWGTRLTFSRKNSQMGQYSFLRNTIWVNTAYAPDENFNTVSHEAIHGLAAMGVFDYGKGKEVWDTLVKYVTDSGLAAQYANHPAYKGMEVEEAIAELYGNYNMVRHSAIKARQLGLTKPIVEALQYIREGFQVVYDWVAKQTHGSGFFYSNLKKPENALRYISEGKLAEAARKYLKDEMFTSYVNTAVRPEKMIRDMDLPPDTKERVLKSKRIGDYYSFMVKWGWNIIQLAQKNQHIQWLQEYVQQANRWYNEKSKWLNRGNDTVVMWNGLSVGEQKNLAELIFEVEEMGYRTPTEIANGVVRKPTRAEMIALAKKHNLTKGGLDVFVKMRGDFDAVLVKMQELAEKDAKRALTSNPIALGLELAKIAKEFGELKKRPYFPHSRFGNYTIVVKDPKGKTLYVESFETEGQRKRAANSVRAKFPGMNVAFSMFPEEISMFRGMPPSLLLMMKHKLNLTQQQEIALEELMVHMSPTQSFKNHFVRKENTPGYSRDALRAFGDYFLHAANHIARLEFAPEMEEAIRHGREDVRGINNAGGDSTKRVKMLDYLTDHLNQIYNPSAEWSTLRSVGFLWHLGFNVKSAVLNFTQLPMTTLPFLTAQYGNVAGSAALTKAMKHFADSFRNPKKVGNYLRNPNNLRAVEQGIEEGFLDESFAAMLAGIAEGGNIIRSNSGSVLYKGMLQFQSMAAYMFQATEKINRRVTFMAALELARNNPNAPYLQEIAKRYNLELPELAAKWGDRNEALAFLAAKDAVDATQFKYASWARPRFMRGKASAFFTFVSFAQNMLWFLRHSPGGSRAMLMLLLMGGLMGMPGAEDLEALVKWAGRNLFGKEWNAEKELRETILTLFGDKVPPDLILRGAARYGFGLAHVGDMMGLPLPQIDMSGNVGMGSPLPIVSPMIQALGREGDWNDKVGRFTQEGVGATFGVGAGILAAIADTDLPLDSQKRWEKALPGAAQSLSKAVRYWTEGETTRSGATIVDFDRTDPVHRAEVYAQALGFRLTRVAQEWDKRIMQMETEVFWESRRGLLLDQFWNAWKSGDVEEVKTVNQNILRFNQEIPYPQMRITAAVKQRSRKGREVSQAKKEAGTPDAKMMEGMYRDIQNLHPEARITVGEEQLPRVK